MIASSNWWGNSSTSPEGVYLAGLAHLALLPAGLLAAYLLNWGPELNKLRPFVRFQFWAYFGYVMAANVVFGVMTLVGANEIARGTPLARAFAACVALWWIVRLVLENLFYPWQDRPLKKPQKIARYALDIVLIALIVGYGRIACGI